MISLEQRIYGLSLLWREAEYNFAFWNKLPGLDWNAAYCEYLPKVIAAEDPLQYYGELMKFMALLRDGHTFVKMPEEIRPPYCVPIRTSYCEGKHIITMLPKDCGVPLYSEILAINEMPLCDYLSEKIYPYIWHEKPDGKFKFGLLGYMIGVTEPGKIKIDTDHGSFMILKNSDVKTLEGNIWPDHPEFRKMKKLFGSDSHSIRVTNDGIVYIVIPTFDCGERLKKEFYQNIPLIKDGKGFIFDLRANGGGDDVGASAVAQVFIDGEFSGIHDKTPAYSACHKAYGHYRNIGKLDLTDKKQKKIYEVCTHQYFEYNTNNIHVPDCPAYLTQPVVLLSDCSTACAAECFLSYFKCSGRGIIVGTNSYGSCGQPLEGELPGGGSYGICTTYPCLADKTEFINIGIKPDIHAEITRQDMQSQFDSVLDMGLKEIRNAVNKNTSYSFVSNKD